MLFKWLQQSQTPFSTMNYFNPFAIFLFASIFTRKLATAEDTEYSSPNCETKGKAETNLDLAVHLIQNVKDSFPSCLKDSRPLDCEDVLRGGQNKTGVYRVWPRSRVTSGPLEVYCDMDTDGGGWTVIQRRGNYLRLKDYFFQDWKSYKEGFGSIERDFWLGNDNIFALSNQKLSSVRFDLEDVEGSRRYALYDTFWIDDEENQYKLHIKGYSGDAGDSMIGSHNDQKFSTKDRENDNAPEANCAVSYKGGWWYNACHSSNLNGLYHRGKHESYADGVNWHAWKGHNDSLESTEIKLRFKDYRHSNGFSENIES